MNKNFVKQIKKIATSAGVSDTRFEIVSKFSEIEMLLLDVLENETKFDFKVTCDWLESRVAKLKKEIPKLRETIQEMEDSLL